MLNFHSHKTFSHGIHPVEAKEATVDKPIRRFPFAPFLVLLLSQHAGRPAKPNTTFCTVDEDFTAYGLLDHRHTPEIEQVTGASVLFTPHLAPMNRGILATCYARPTGATSTAAVLDTLRAAYADEPFVVVTEGSPSTKATLGSNCAHVTARYDERTGWVLAIAAIDNITKGASGQAVQCANLLLSLPETTGLPIVGVYP